MSSADTGVGKGGSKIRSLADTLNEIRNDQANRTDVVVDMQQAARARLELLADDLQPIFDEIPYNNDQFDFGMTRGEDPRLWIDLTSFVRMGRDRRSYEFVKDTRLGRTILRDSEDRAAITGAVTRYVAERILEREQAFEGDWIALKEETRPESSNDEITSTNPGISTWLYLLVFVTGLLAGALAMVAWAWFGTLPGG